MTEAPASPSQLGIFRKWIFERFAIADWHSPEERQAAYRQISDAIDRMRTDVHDAAVINSYREILAELRVRIEARVDACRTLTDLEAALDGKASEGSAGGSAPALPDAEAVQPAPVPALPPVPGLVGGESQLREPILPTAAVEQRNDDRSPSSSMGRMTAKLDRLGKPGHLALIAAGIGLAIVASLVALWQASSRSECGPASTACFDSGWQAVSSKATTVYFFRHRLGAAPRNITVWFSPTADGVNAFPLLWKFPRNETGNPVTIEVRSDIVLVNIWNGVPLFGAYDASTDRWTTYTDGFYRVVARQ